MAVEVCWDDAQHTIVRVVLRDWGWDELADVEAANARLRLLDDVEHPVTMLVILHDTPRNLLGMLPRLAQSAAFNHPKIRQVIVVADSNIVKMAAEIFKRIYGHESRRMRLVATLSEAYQLAASAQTDTAAPED